MGLALPFMSGAVTGLKDFIGARFGVGGAEARGDEYVAHLLAADWEGALFSSWTDSEGERRSLVDQPPR